MEQHRPRLKRQASLARFCPHVPHSLASTLGRTDSLSNPQPASRSLIRSMTRSPNLGISVKRDHGDASVSPLSSPRTPHTPGPHSPFSQSFAEGHEPQPPQSPIAAIPLPPSPRTKSSKSFFSNSKASRSTTKLPKPESPARQPARSSSPGGGALSQVYGFGRSMASSPELGTTAENNFEESTKAAPVSIDSSTTLPATAGLSSAMNAPKKKQSKHKFNILGRKGSVKDEDSQNEESRGKSSKTTADKNRQFRETRSERSNKDKATSSRNRSNDRSVLAEDDNNLGINGHASLRHDIRNTSTRAADGLGRAAKGLFGKLSTRSNQNESSREAREAAERAARDTARDEAEAQKAAQTKSYNVVNLPLEEQTRLTRICKRLEDCKDKTEFWLPAVAYRCIDYLNDKGMTHEGLYRVPGSEREIRNWIYRFDKEADIDLLGENDLYDVNTISSMFKAWLRDLPEEVFPKPIQHRITSAVGSLSDQQRAPQLLKSELSKLPPFNYYLLFAVTAHITMLLNASKENKMSFHNLCVCFMPALKMEMPCFSWLILDWKNCWEGCSTERDYLEREYSMQEKRGGPDGDGEGRSRPVQHFDRYPPPNGSQPASKGSGDAGDVPRPSTSQATVNSAGLTSHNFPNPRTGSTNGEGQSTLHANTPSTVSNSDRPITSPTSSSAKPNHDWNPADASTNRRDKYRPAPLESVPSGSSISSRSRKGSDPSESTANSTPVHRGQYSDGDDDTVGRSSRNSRRPQGIARPDRSKAHYDGNFGDMKSSRSGKEANKVQATPGSSSRFQSLTASSREKDALGASAAPELSPLKPMSPFGSLSEI